MERTHGGDWAAYESEYARAALDFSANVSPLGVPWGVREAIARAAGECDRYPDPLCCALREALAEKEGVPAEQVLVGNGAAALLWRITDAARPKRALVTAPCFGEYEAAAEARGCAVTRYALDAETFRLDEGFLDAVDGADLVFLSQPNNPSGVSVEPALLRRILARCRAAGARLVLDECFLGFLDAPERYSLREELGAYPELIVVDAFTKLCGMAGVRLGYALCADRDFLERVRRAGPPWSVSHLAQAAGLAALRDTDYVRRVHALVAAERERLSDALRALGLRIVPGEANFLLFRCVLPLDAPLRERGILIRRCGDFAGLDDTWYRTAVRTREENERLVEAIREVTV